MGDKALAETKTPLLDRVRGPADLRKLDAKQLRQFADEDSHVDEPRPPSPGGPGWQGGAPG